ncbi:hypothetical protein HYU10_04940 [Candidatus Woesearchaeota archaeon]|nr:hypothetical protein [Candidatus Woesearchaeota archaeon]
MRDSADRNNNLKVVIDYTDTTGERRSVEKNVPIQFRASSGDTAQTMGHMPTAQQTSFWQSKTFYALILVIIAAGFVIYRKKEWREKIPRVFKKK